MTESVNNRAVIQDLGADVYAIDSLLVGLVGITPSCLIALARTALLDTRAALTARHVRASADT